MGVDASRTRTIVVAVDSFKSSIGAADAASAIGAGWSRERPNDDVALMPMADGGEGTLRAFEVAVPGSLRMPLTVRGPDGALVESAWLLLPDGTGVVELASTSGIELLGDRRRPHDADTFGFGQAIMAALDHGVARLVLGIGSSASTDLGLGALRALGASLLDAGGAPIRPGLRGVVEVASVDLSSVAPLPRGGVVVLSDVTNPLGGPTGAAAVFGPQKGLEPGEIEVADAALLAAARLLPAEPERPGAGAAGGTGFALLAWGADLVPGAAEVARLIGLENAVAKAAVVITGEGAYDSQSAAGKVPGFVSELAATNAVPAVLVAGRIAEGADVTGFEVTLSLARLAGSAEAAMREPAQWLELAGSRLARAIIP